MDSDPPLLATYKPLFTDHPDPLDNDRMAKIEQCDLPLIDLSRLNGSPDSAELCRMEIVRAASEWGFFQVINHNISNDVLEKLREMQVSVFREPFEKKRKEKLKDLLPDSYSWGTPSATSLEQLSWSEAYHIPLSSATNSSDRKTRNIIEEISDFMSQLAHKLATILSRELGDKNGSYIKENCTCNTCYLRLNHYPPCPEPSGAFGLAPHTDSDFLTVLYQDQVGGLQLLKEERWLTVRPNPNALIINIGDLFQAWSNDLYKSVKHRVMTNTRIERFSVAFFLCPSYDTVIKGYSTPTIYKKFSFGEYRSQIKEDVRVLGHKIGLNRFLA